MKRSLGQQSLEQLNFERKWLVLKLGNGQLNTLEEAATLDAIETLELGIAATPCESLLDVVRKLERVGELFNPTDEQMLEDCLEFIMLTSVLRDVRALANKIDVDSLNL